MWLYLLVHEIYIHQHINERNAMLLHACMLKKKADLMTVQHTFNLAPGEGVGMPSS